MDESRTSDEVMPIGSTALSNDQGKISDECLRENKVENLVNSDMDEGANKSETSEKLLELLAKQLLYYFSSQNLSKDTYLKTLMELNSGHVPVGIVSNFSNITRIIMDSLADGETISSLDVPGLVRKAALWSEFLEMVVLDQNGSIIENVEDGDYRQETGRPTFFAIKPTSARPTDHDTSQPLRRVRKQGSGEKAKNDSPNIIILRDVHEDATEQDIREIFKINANTSISVTDVRSEIGNCWFVTLGPTKRQQDTVDMLLSLRSMKICDQPIKARLKTQHIASSTIPSPIETAPSSPGYNPYRSWNRSKTVGVLSTRYDTQIYSGDRVYYGGKKHTGEKGRGFVAGGGFSKSPRGNRGDTGSDSNEIISKGNVDPVKKLDIVLPPPSCEKNFPSLQGNSPKSAISDVDDKFDPEKDVAGITANKHRIVTAASPSILSKESATPTGGYAAALLKAAPSTNDTVATIKAVSLPTLNASKSVERKRLVPRHEPAINSMTTKSLGTSTTDDANCDDKSSISSKPESERSINAGTLSSRTIVTRPVASVGWGRGPSFAEMVKKQEAIDYKPVRN